MSIIYKVVKDVLKEGGLIQQWFGKGLLRGVVLNSNSEPIQGVEISIGENQTERTTYQGSFLFTNLRGKYKISLEIGESQIEDFDVLYIKGGQEYNIEIVLDESFVGPIVSNGLQSDVFVDNSFQELTKDATNESSLTDDVTHKVTCTINGEQYQIERYRDKSIKVRSLRTNFHLDVVLPFLREAIRELGLDISLTHEPSGKKKNTQNLGREIIQVLSEVDSSASRIHFLGNETNNLKQIVHFILEENRGHWTSDITDVVLQTIETDKEWLSIYWKVKELNGSINSQIGRWVSKYTGFVGSKPANSMSGIASRYTVLIDPNN